MMNDFLQLAISFVLISAARAFSTSFLQPALQQNRASFHRVQSRLHAIDISELSEFLGEYYPEFDELVKPNDDLWKALRDAEDGFTIFAPSSEAFENLGSKKQEQLTDPRNKETTDKIGAYHAIGEAVSADQLFAAGGVLTVGGEVPIERSTTGGMFGFGGKEDGGVTIGTAKVVQSYQVSNGIVHEVDALVSPNILWRYMDQLRIPGSR
mmetsp:Transcript_1840/g.2790  ORF Transcript_1840/g.2790 Transcript_1840/m.2790 type:complete len:210 (+) Transcript_1840:91-720(+)|eukprot:CAMPEP_0195522466 /NCGR_PEP_ID=MMETSP0794_2-20130614/20671_1 /TAXON_ID=515487 /ORGANISM="Stephanopyxis turris, Strain CCMP 815" /LENGTH=209 /DNA_ID=CAMNT_0040652229 /DNA_START=91 /DNA_END=720 /DNA_ORIENTATION=+